MEVIRNKRKKKEKVHGNHNVLKIQIATGKMFTNKLRETRWME